MLYLLQSGLVTSLLLHSVKVPVIEAGAGSGANPFFPCLFTVRGVKE